VACKVKVTDNKGGSIALSSVGRGFRTSEFHGQATGPTGTAQWGGTALTYTIDNPSNNNNGASRIGVSPLAVLFVAVAACFTARLF